MTPAPKNGTGELRHDLEPLTRRFGALGQPQGATWMSGTTGSAAVPGPSTYWIDAVVQLAPAQAAALRQRHALQASATGPALVPGLTGHLPAGPWQVAASLDDALSTGGWAVKAHLAGDALVLSALGQ